MELMPIDVVYDALYAALSLSDSSLQIWTSFTFALIVAVHLGGARIGRSTYRLISGLYGLYACVLIIRYCSAAFQIIHYQNLLAERSLEPWPVPKAVGIMIGSGTLILMLGGTIATLWFVHAVRKEHEQSHTPGQAGTGGP